jgi:hypothetical protein
MARNDGGGKPKRKNPFKQVYQVFTTVRTVDPKIGWWMLLAFVVTVLVIVGIGAAVGHWVYALIMGVPFALLAAMVVLSRRGERAAYRAMENQTGGTAGALRALRRGWYYDEEPVAADVARPGEMTNAAMVFRALGKPGVVLLGEGPEGRARKLLEKERKKVARVAPGVPIHTLQVGSGDGQTPVRKVSRTMQKLKPVLTKDEMSVVNKRLKSLPGIRQGLPPGVDPMKARMDRKALRGR